MSFRIGPLGDHTMRRARHLTFELLRLMRSVLSLGTLQKCVNDSVSFFNSTFRTLVSSMEPATNLV
jgi:hypothetical protein